MASKKKLLQAAAGSAGGAGLDVDEVFSTYLYEGTGTGSNLTVTNNIDLSTEGGLVWVKNRDATAAHALFDTVRGQNVLESQSDGGQDAFSAYGGSASASYNTNGFGINGTGASNLNQSGVDYASWTFRKAPKFFDVVTYTGNSTSGRQIAHNLGAVPGMMIIKKTSGSGGWRTYHRGANGGTNPENYYADLNDTAAFSSLASVWNQTAPTATHFTLGDQIHVNKNGETFVAYLFAHNNSDGEFGPDGDADIIKCGSYTGNGSTTGPVIDLGFEPQWLLIKRATNTANWFLVDNMRGLPVGANSNPLFPNSSNAESTSGAAIDVLPTGFQPKASSIFINNSGDTYIYMAIRRGPLAAPDDATKVFAMDTGSSSSPAFTAGFPVDMAFKRHRTATDNWRITARLIQGINHFTNTTNADDVTPSQMFDYQNGYYDDSQSSSNQAWMWKRAPGYFDVCCYSGTGSARTVAHNLGAVPEMMWVKRRDSTDNWSVYHKDLNVGSGQYLQLNVNSSAATNSNQFTTTAPTASVFSVGSDGAVNGSGSTYIAYLFATVAGVSKVGSYTGTGNSDITVDCGFSSGARFVLIKKASGSGSWYVADTARGIVSGTDNLLTLNTNFAATTGNNLVDPSSSGFIVSGGAEADSDWNDGGATFIFYAIA